MNRLEAMSVLLAVVDAGSFSGASRTLRMPLPTVSRKVAELERHLKSPLLIRSTRKLALTESGAAYVAACRQILEQVAEADRRATGEYRAPRGELCVTAAVVFGRMHVVPVVARLLADYPDVDVRLELTDRYLDLIDEHVDVALRIGTLPDSRLVATRVGQVRTVACASPAYLEKHGTPRKPADLAAHDCVTFAMIGGAQSWVFRDAETVRVRSRLTVNTAEAAIDAAIAGVGIARVLSYQVAELVRGGALDVVLRKHEPAPAPVNIVYNPQLVVPAKVRAFIDLAAPQLKERLALAA
jgi:DNA-binding transcriptional LysR family regulator